MHKMISHQVFAEFVLHSKPEKQQQYWMDLHKDVYKVDSSVPSKSLRAPMRAHARARAAALR